MVECVNEAQALVEIALAERAPRRARVMGIAQAIPQGDRVGESSGVGAALSAAASNRARNVRVW